MDQVHTFSVQAMVYGYHVYKSIWDAACDDDILPCKREVGNPHDPSTVAVKKRTVVVGHVPRKISIHTTKIMRIECELICINCVHNEFALSQSELNSNSVKPPSEVV